MLALSEVAATTEENAVHEDPVPDEPANEPADKPAGEVTHKPATELTDDELRALGKTLGTLVQYVMRDRQENPEAGAMSVMSVIARRGPCRVGEVAHLLSLDLSTVSRHVQNLERTGYVEKASDPNDRRATTLSLTHEGAAHIEQFWTRRTAQMRDGLSHWDPEDLRTLKALLARYTEDLSALTPKAPDDKH